MKAEILIIYIKRCSKKHQLLFSLNIFYHTGNYQQFIFHINFLVKPNETIATAYTFKTYTYYKRVFNFF